jgi:hypothetical protein
MHGPFAIRMESEAQEVCRLQALDLFAGRQAVDGDRMLRLQADIGQATIRAEEANTTSGRHLEN